MSYIDKTHAFFDLQFKYPCKRFFFYKNQHTVQSTNHKTFFRQISLPNKTYLSWRFGELGIAYTTHYILQFLNAKKKKKSPTHR